MSGILQGVLASIGNTEANYIEDVFSTFLYTGNGSTQTITNGIDLAGEGGLTWFKGRGFSENHNLLNTITGITKSLATNNTSAEITNSGAFASFNADGFTLGAVNAIEINASGRPYCSWTFRKAPKFFDVVTWSGNSVQGRTISHSLGSTPGMIIVKSTSNTSNWTVYHRSLPTDNILQLNSTTAQINVGSPNAYVSAPTSTTFTLGSDTDVNGSGRTYVAYLFAHNAGGFGTAGTDNVISCGSFTTAADKSYSVNLGYEPQYVLVKAVSGTENWIVSDIMRGMAVTTPAYTLYPNTSGAEGSILACQPSSTGFFGPATPIGDLQASTTYIYMAIRRPMKPPTSGTQVFSPYAYVTPNPQTSLPYVDYVVLYNTAGANVSLGGDRLRGAPTLNTRSTNIETTGFGPSYTGTGFTPWSPANIFGQATVAYAFRRAPGFFDQVCYTGTGSNTAVTHNLGAVPELMIIKRRNVADDWFVYAAPLGNTKKVQLNYDVASDTQSTAWNNTTPTSTVFTVGTASAVNASGSTYVAYLFASIAGVSKVGSYTGTGATQTINAGLPTGVRFVFIKRTDSTGDWWAWDTDRGMVAGTDPRIPLNATAAELNNNWVYTVSTGFQIVTTDASVNASGGTYIYLAIA